MYNIHSFGQVNQEENAKESQRAEPHEYSNNHQPEEMIKDEVVPSVENKSEASKSQPKKKVDPKKKKPVPKAADTADTSR